MSCTWWHVLSAHRIKMCLYIDRWVSAGLLAEIYPSSLVQSLELGWSAIVRVSYRVSVILKEVLKKYKNDQLSCNGSLYLFVLDALIASSSHTLLKTDMHTFTLQHADTFEIITPSDIQNMLKIRKTWNNQYQWYKQQNNTNYPKPSHSVRKCRRPWVPVCRANKNRSRSSLCMRLIHL